MTCIVAYKFGDKMYMGADCAASNGHSSFVVVEPKVMKKTVEPLDDSTISHREMLIGYTTSFRMGQLLMHKFKPPKFYENEDAMEYMVSKFVPAIMNLFDNNYYGKKEDYQEMNGGNFLVCYNGRIFEISGDFAVLERRDQPFNSCGCGEDHALAAMTVLDKHQPYGPEPIEIVREAIETAAQYSTGVSLSSFVDAID